MIPYVLLAKQKDVFICHSERKEAIQRSTTALHTNKSTHSTCLKCPESIFNRLKNHKTTTKQIYVETCSFSKVKKYYYGVRQNDQPTLPLIHGNIEVRGANSPVFETTGWSELRNGISCGSSVFLRVYILCVCAAFLFITRRVAYSCSLNPRVSSTERVTLAGWRVKVYSRKNET